MVLTTEELRQELKNYLIYIGLMTSLSTEKYNVIKNPELKQHLLDTNEMIEKADYKALLTKGPYVKQLLQPLLDYFRRVYPLKKSIETIASEFNGLFGKNNPYFTGVELGWLQSVMDLSAKNWPRDLPYQTRIGLGHHAGYANIEDEFLIRDAFYAFIKAEDAYELLLSVRDKLKEKSETTDLNFDKSSYTKLTLLKFNVAAYSRLSIISFYSFMECFVNTIGFDFYFRNKNKLGDREIEILQGKKKDRFLQLEYKLEKYPTIIRQDDKQVIFIKDDKQLKEPFRTFFKEYKNLRDASVHYAPLKEKIWLNSADWIAKAQQFKDLIVDSALTFWKACYPESDGPEYLGKLDQNKHLELAKKRLETEQEMKDYAS